MTLGEGLVWVGMAFYFARFGIQWFLSERAKKSVTPRIFWVLSLIGVGFGLSGTLLQAQTNDDLWILVPSFMINAAVYARNLFIDDKGGLGPVPAAALGLVAAGGLILFNLDRIVPDVDGTLIFLAMGAIGQAIYSSRFVLQWYLSEKRGLSHFPIAFWWLSLVGAALNLAYTIWLGKPEFIAGYIIGWIVPARNIWLEWRRPSAPTAPSSS
jgi:lipid-A-disaccharide synthase-like uncharacterized protein